MEPNDEAAKPSYWYDNSESLVAILHALRRFRRTDQEMRRRMSADMDMNVSDMQALQFVIAAEGQEELATPRALSQYLGISSASTTKLLDRLTASGHLERHPHPTDRRALVLTCTPHAHDEIRDRLSRMHVRMREIAASIPPESRQAVIDFLTAMADHLESEGSVAPLTP